MNIKGCKPKNFDDCKTLNKLVNMYLKKFSKEVKREIHCFKNLRNNLDKTIRCALALCEDKDCKFSHHFRLSYEKRKKVMSLLIEKRRDLESSKNFDEIKKVVESCYFKGFGELSIYDVSYKIGLSKSFFPKKVYLHRGTRDGSRILFQRLGKQIRNDYIEIVDIPHILRRLEPYHLENFLCLCKDRFNEVSL